MTAVPAPAVIDAARTAAELRRKLKGLRWELGEWRAETDGDAAPLRRHKTQVAAVAGTLEQASEEVEAKLLGAEEGMWILERARSIDRRILDLHRLWGFFRDKLALRYVPFLERSLVTADDVAWACYGPAQEHIPADRRREPPLVYFTGGASPFLMPRGTPYLVEPLPDGGMRQPQFDEAVRSVPVALIGLPWFQIDHLPAAPLIAHEVGHAVEQDLELGDAVCEVVKAAVPAERRDAWAAWSGEAFADVYGVLACGSGFCRALAAKLGAHPRDVAGERDEKPGEDGWGSYPTKTARLCLAEAALRELGVEPADGSLVDEWRASYPERPLTAVEDDAEKVAAAILEGPYGALDGAGLGVLLPYVQGDEDTAGKLAKRLVKGLEIQSGDVRQVIAAVRLAYDRDRAAFVRYDAAALAIDWIPKVPMQAVRAAGGADTPPEPERAARDRGAGLAIAARILGAEDPDDQEEGNVPA